MKTLKNICILLFDFLVCSFIGWIYEVLITWALYGRYIDRGYLPLPLCPIYGIGAFIMLITAGRIKNPVLIFIVTAAAATALELAASYMIEAVLHYQLWEYNNWAFNFEGRIALGSSLIFGGMGLILIKLVHPSAVKLIGKLFEKCQKGKRRF